MATANQRQPVEMVAQVAEHLLKVTLRELVQPHKVTTAEMQRLVMQVLAVVVVLARWVKFHKQALTIQAVLAVQVWLLLSQDLRLLAEAAAEAEAQQV